MATVRNPLWSAAQAMLGLLFPPECTFCRALLGEEPREVFLCDDCRSLLTAGGPQCRFCACPTPQGAEGLPKCVRCQGIRWYFDRIHALGPYSDMLRDAVLKTKTPPGDPLARALGQRLAERVAQEVVWEGIELDVVVPVPLFWLRRMEHGTNNAETIGEMLAGRLGLPLCADGLLRTRWTAPQSSVTGAERANNIRGAIAANDSYDWQNARVLVVDDVVTTGSTVNECAKVLRAAGASTVQIAALARTSGEVRIGPRPKL